jgi:hypothetical protein
VSLMSVHVKYQALLLKGDGEATYETTEFLAADNLEAIEKAKNWTSGFKPIAEDAWLQITLYGVGIRSLRQGEF